MRMHRLAMNCVLCWWVDSLQAKRGRKLHVELVKLGIGNEFKNRLGMWNDVNDRLRMGNAINNRLYN